MPNKFPDFATLFYPHESVAQAVTLPLKGQQVTMMCQAVNHSRSHLVIGKDGASLGKLQIGGNDETPALVAACDQLEEELCLLLLQWKITPLVQNYQFRPVNGL